MKLKPFTARLVWSEDGVKWGRTIEVWVANLTAARESAESFVREEGLPADTTIRVTPKG